MCGIAGFYALNNDHSKMQNHVTGQKMIAALHHRGPDNGDLWQDPTTPILLAHRRLAILDLSPEGAQPMASTSGRYIITYNGEIYNHPTIRTDLENTGHIFKGRSDTETILAAIEYWGLNQTLQKITGMFAFALWDRKEKQLHFIRDRMGKKPLYIGWTKTALIFASELKALRAHPDFEPEINKEAVALYMRYANVPAPHSIYKNIWHLPPAHRLTLDTEALKTKPDLPSLMRPYWSATESLKIARTNPVNKPEAQIIEDFEALLNQCVHERTLSDVPLGSFLSGGIDSSLVTALMQKSSPVPIKTYSIGFNEDGFDEAQHAKKIATHLGTEHFEHYCTPQDARDVIPMLSDIYDEPFADQSAIPTYLVSKFARQNVTVALTGDGGDELLGGYTRHISGPRIYSAMRRLPAPLRRALSNIITTLSPEQWQALRRTKPLFGNHMHKTAAILRKSTQEDIYTRLVSQWEQTPSLTHTGIDLQTINALPHVDGLSFAEHIMLWDTLTYLPNDILTKLDRASMATSLEARAPLLDHRLYEYAAALPLNMKIRAGKGKYILREILARNVPRELFERPKQGFNIPLDEWLRTNLRDWAEDLLNETTLKNQNLLNAKIIRNSWNAHLKGQGNHTNALWTVLMFQAWHKRWM